MVITREYQINESLVPSHCQSARYENFTQEDCFMYYQRIKIKKIQPKDKKAEFLKYSFFLKRDSLTEE